MAVGNTEKDSCRASVAHRRLGHDAEEAGIADPHWRLDHARTATRPGNGHGPGPAGHRNGLRLMLGVGVDPLDDPIHRLSWDGHVRNVIDQAWMSDRLPPLNEVAAQSILKTRWRLGLGVREPASGFGSRADSTDPTYVGLQR